MKSSFGIALAVAVPTMLIASVVNADTRTYTSVIDALNNSGVSGSATIVVDTDAKTLDVTVNALGLLPNQVHAQHIHGLLNNGFATCPTMAQDANKDGFLSVLEGAVNYGPIKLNLTSPPTPFGPSPDPVLFASYAGTPDLTKFPTAPDGTINYHELITFNLNNSADAAAFAQLQDIDNQHIVLHGAFAPESVDTVGGDPTNIIYDGLLPVACGEFVLQDNGAGVPEPSTLGLLGFGAAGLLMRRRVKVV